MIKTFNRNIKKNIFNKMNINGKNEEIKIYVFFILIFLLITPSQTFKYYKSFTLLSKKILLITNEGIIKYDPLTKEKDIIQSSNLITSSDDLELISFVQSPSDEGGYIFCRLKNKIFIFDENLINYSINFEVNEISNFYTVINPYKTSEGKLALIISFINSDKYIRVLIYQININDETNPGNLIKQTTKKVLNPENNNLHKAISKGITCQLISSSDYTNKLLECFTIEMESFSIVGVIFNPENDNDSLFLKYSQNAKKTGGSEIINSAISLNKDKILICFLDYQGLIYCLLYICKSNLFNEIIKINIKCSANEHNMGVKYNNEKQEYIIFCSSISNMYLIKFDQNIKIKDINENNEKCYTLINAASDYYYTIYSLDIAYIQDEGKYYLLKSYSNNNAEEDFNLLNIPETCNTKSEIEDPNPNNNDDSIDINPISSTILFLSSSQKIILEKAETTIPLTLTLDIKTESLSTAFENKNELSTRPKLEIPSTNLEIKNNLPSTTLKIEIPSSISEIKNGISSTIFDKNNFLVSTFLEIQNDLLSTTLETKKELPTETLKIITTSLEAKNVLSTTSPTILEIKSEISRISSLEIKNEITTTVIEIKNELPTTALNTSIIILDNKNENSITILNIKSELPKTIIEIKNELSSKILDIENKSSIIYFPSTTPSLSSTIFFPSSSFVSNNLIVYKNNYISFYEEGNVIKGKINKTKEEFEKSLDEFMEIIQIRKKYEITGIDYNITITPINDINSFKSSFIDFSICEEILRRKYNIPPEEILTILQIEIDKMNEKALTSQIEYAIYDKNKTKLDLTSCQNLEIKVTYDIKNESALNKEMISYYSNLGIDIFNSNDSFFNNLCYPFSIANSDIILKDRLLDIYQNYSLCDNDCEYDSIDIANMSVTCFCPVKTEINTEIAQLSIGKIVQSTFKDSNIGVVRCYDLVFTFEHKFHNIGFLVFSLFVIAHIICFIFFFISGIKSIVLFVFKEMYKNNYITPILNPKKKTVSKRNLSLLEDINSNNDYYSSIYLKQFKILKRVNNNIKNKSPKINNKSKELYKEQNFFSKKSIKKNQPKFILNCKYNNNHNKYKNKSSSKTVFKEENHNIKDLNNKSKSLKVRAEELNKEKNFPGYYNLIQINANNSKNNKPPDSNYILDNYNYEEAIKFDTRDFWRIFFICLLSKENILNTFFFKDPLESQPIRISHFIFCYSCDYALNALFYFNQKISDKYHYKGDSLYFFIFVNNMTISIFSTLFSYLLQKSLKFLTNSKTSIENLFKEEEQKMRKNKKYKVDNKKKKDILASLLNINKIMKIKIICYIIIEFLIMLFFLYFITAFFEVYRDTQISLLYDSFISFLLSNLIDILISFFISFLYISAIKFKLKFLYNIVLFSYGLG